MIASGSSMTALEQPLQALELAHPASTSRILEAFQTSALISAKSLTGSSATACGEGSAGLPEAPTCTMIWKLTWKKLRQASGKTSTYQGWNAAINAMALAQSMKAISGNAKTATA